MKYIVFSAAAIGFLSCAKTGFEGMPEGNNVSGNGSATIDASCEVAGLGGNGIGTKAIIGQTTVTSIAANFIKLDEVRLENITPDEYSPTTLDSWSSVPEGSEGTKILEAAILSSPDNTKDIHFRSIVFNPRQTYPYAPNPDDVNDVVGYITRMVGWYPKTVDLRRDSDGVPVDTRLVDTETFTRITKDGETHDCIVFKNKLDGQTDLMMTDMREGRYELHSKGFKNNASDRTVQPYGHIFNNLLDPTDGYYYCNYFTFKHYLTGVRLFITADASSLSLLSWRKIIDVVFLDQPRSVTIALPETQARSSTEFSSLYPGLAEVYKSLPVEGVEPVYGEAMEWSDRTNMSIIKTAMAENDPYHPEFAEIPQYPLVMTNGVDFERTFLGYFLAEPRPESGRTEIEVHTEAGVFTAYIPNTITYTDGSGASVTEEIMQPGHIYNIVLNIKTDGSLDVIVGSEDDEAFRDLAPYNTNISDFEYANCFVITPELMTKEDGNMYDGFFFHAVTPGCGDRGMISGGYPTEAMFEPVSAQVLWQDTQALITHVDLVHGYVRFTLNDQCRENGMKGNAVIAVYDSDGNILWSWHIWVTDGLADITYENISYQDREFGTYNSSSNTWSNTTPRTKTFSMMNMNLGATAASWSSGGDPLPTYGLYYQWGRKDPLPGPPTYNYERADLSAKEYYYRDEGARSLIYDTMRDYPDIETSVRLPVNLLTSSLVGETYANDWLYTSVDGLWGYHSTSTEREVLKKTIYDPCPYGYRVADDELFAIFYSARYDNSSSWSEIDNKGIRISLGSGDNYFPFAGWRGQDRGRTDKSHAWFHVGEVGDYQDARICKNAELFNNHRGRVMLVENSLLTFTVQDVSPSYTTSITLDYANRTTAAPVRCVRYDAEPQNN